MRGDHRRCLHEIGDEREIPEGVERHRAKVRRRCERDRRHADGVAVGCGFGERGESDGPAATGAVIDDDGLAERIGKDLRRRAADEVRRTARRKGDDEPQRFRRPLLRVRGERSTEG